jgi:hypothetical protein
MIKMIQLAPEAPSARSGADAGFFNGRGADSGQATKQTTLPRPHFLLKLPTLHGPWWYFRGVLLVIIQ